MGATSPPLSLGTVLLTPPQQFQMSMFPVGETNKPRYEDAGAPPSETAPLPETPLCTNFAFAFCAYVRNNLNLPVSC